MKYPCICMKNMTIYNLVCNLYNDFWTLLLETVSVLSITETGKSAAVLQELPTISSSALFVLARNDLT